MSASRAYRSSAAVAVCIVSLATCSGGEKASGSAPIPPVASITLTPQDTTIDRGQTTRFTVTLRDALGNLLAGRTVSWASSNTTVASVDAGGLVTAFAPGSATITAAIEGKTASAMISVRQPLGSFSLSASQSVVSIAQGGSPATSTIAIARTGGFNAAVGLSVTGAPPGLSASLDQASATGNTATLTVQAVASVAAQQYSLTITGTATNLPSQTTTVQVVVSAPAASGNVTLDFSACDGPVWVAAQDGNGAWSQVVRTNGVYRFSVTSGKGGYATAWDGDYSGRYFSVAYMTQSELTAAPQVFCRPADRKWRVHGAAFGFNSLTESAYVSMGGASAGVRYLTPSFTLYSVLPGNQDLLAYRSNVGGPSTNDRAVILRDRDIPADGSVGTVDFAGSGAFAPASASLTVVGAGGGDMIWPSMSYATGASCSSGHMYSVPPESATRFTMYGIPAAQQRASDFHALYLSAVNDSTSSRSVRESFHTMANRTITLGAPLPTPTVTSLAAPYKRLQATVAIPSDYQALARFSYWTDVLSGEISATYGWLGGESVTLAIPDFTAVSGWSNHWVPPTSATVNWSFEATGSNPANGAFCSEGASFRTASVRGKN